MSLFGFDNSSKSTTSLQDRRQAIGDAGTGVSGDRSTAYGSGALTATGKNSSVSLTSNSSTVNTTTTTTVDGGAIKLAGEVAKDGLALGGKLGSDAMLLSESSQRMGLQFASDAMTTSSGVMTYAMEGLVAGQKNALESNVRVIDSAIKGMLTTQADAIGLTRSVTSDAMTLADRSQGRIAQTAADALGLSSHVVDRALALINTSGDTVNNAMSQVARAYDTATNYQAEKATTDSRYLVIAGLVLFGIFAVKGFK
jgi:hypothetical protein